MNDLNLNNPQIIRAVQRILNEDVLARAMSSRKSRDPFYDYCPVRKVTFHTTALHPRTKQYLSRRINRFLRGKSTPAWFACQWSDNVLTVTLPLNDDYRRPWRAKP